MNKFSLLALFMSSQLGFAAECVQPKTITEFRELTCQVQVKNVDTGKIIFQSAPSVELPEDAFNYTYGMQTFWVPLKTSYYDKAHGRANEVTLTVALDKIGSESKILDVRTEVKDLKSQLTIASTPEIIVKSDRFSRPIWLNNTQDLVLDCKLAIASPK